MPTDAQAQKPYPRAETFSTRNAARASSSFVTRHFLHSTGAVAMLAVTVLATFFNSNVQAAAFTDGDIVVYRVGDGVTTITSAGNPVFLDEYNTSGTLIQSIAMPTTSSGSVNALIAAGTSTIEGLLTRSTDGRYLMLTGYKSTVGTASLTSSSSSSTPRTVGRVDSSGNIDTSTALTDFSSGSNPRSAVSTDGTVFWVGGGAGGVRYVSALGNTTSLQINTGTATLANVRQVNIFNGQLYYSDSSTSGGNTIAVGSIGSGLPTTAGQNSASVITLTQSGDAYGYFFAILNGGTTPDTVYVADNTAGTITKYALVSGSWTSKGTITLAKVLSLTATVSGTTVILYATAVPSTTTATIYKVTDTAGYNAAPSTTTPTLIVTAPSNKAFRGIALAPVAIPSAPTANAGSSVTSSGFTANWSAVSGATSYQLDVSTVNTFASYVSGYQNLPVSGTSQAVSGLSAGTPYYYRVRAVNSAGSASANSSTITVNTSSAGTPTINVILPGQTTNNSTETPTAQTAGTAFNITLVATIDGTTTNTSYTESPSVTFSGPTGSPTYPATVSFVNGVGMANITLTKNETPTIKATTSDITTGTASSSFLVLPGAIAAYTVTASTPQIVGIAFPVTNTAYDAYSNVATNRSATVTMSSSSGTVTFDNNPVNLNIASGTVVVNATDSAAETITITATDGPGKTGTSGSIVVNALKKYRSLTSGNWGDYTTWQVDLGDGNGFVNASSSGQTPTYADGTVEIRNGHTVAIMASVTVDQVTVDNGGTLTLSSTATLTVNDGSGDDITVQNGGVFVLTNTLSWISGADARINNGGTLRMATSGLAGNGTGVNVANYIYDNGSILEFAYPASTPAASGVTYFPNVDANTIPVFRLTSINAGFSIGGSSATIINGVFEANTANSWAGTATKTFRNGIRGTGNTSQGSAGGQFIINGVAAELGGAGTLTLTNAGLQISAGSVVTLSSDKTVNLIANATGSSTISVAGTLDVNSHILTTAIAPTFTGTNLTEINRSASPTSGKIALTGGTLTYGGVLTVNNLGSAPVNGDSFTLFSAPAYSSWFSVVNLPGLTAGLTWDTNGLATTGVLSIYAFTTNAFGTMTVATNSSATLLIAKVLAKTSGGRGTLSLGSVSNPSANGGTVTANASTITYTPLSGFTSDSFTCVVQDTNGATATVQVLVTVIDPSNPVSSGNGSNLNIVDNGGGNVRLIISGTPGVMYQLQYSTTMASPSWTPLGSAFTMPDVGLTNILDTIPSGDRYYRTVLPSP